MTLGYVTIGTDDIEGAQPFFDAALSPLGYERTHPFPGFAMYGPKGADAVMGLCRPHDGGAARAGNGIMVAFEAPSNEQIDACHAAAMAAGGTDEGGPGFRPPEATSGFYAAYFRDPVGNKFCVYRFS